MPSNHKVSQGECLSSIAKRYGFTDYRVIYNHPSNAAFKQKRPNPNVIFPGDIIVIPDNELKEEPGATEKKHVFKLKRDEVKLRLIVKDDQDNSFANTRYELKIDDLRFTGKTGGDGKIEQEIPADARTGELAVFPSDDVVAIFSLELGELDPVEENTGVQARLNNLGFHCGAVDGMIGPMTQGAIRSFQKKNGLPETGNADTATRNKLKQVHDWE